MLPIFSHAIRRLRGQILAWGLGLGLTALFEVTLYDTVLEQRAVYDQMMQNFPPAVMAFFGGFTDMFSPAGYLSIYFYAFIAVIVGIYAVLAGSGLLASDEEKGTLDLILAHPVSRTAVFFGRLLAFITATLDILFLTWLGFIALLGTSQLEVSPVEIAFPLVSLFALLLVYGCLALFLSMVLPSRSAAAGLAAMYMVTDYFIASLQNLNPNLEAVARFFPMAYFQSGEAVNGLNGAWIGGLLAVAAALALLAWLLFLRRDIRVAGEGGWQISSLRRARKSPAGS